MPLISSIPDTLEGGFKKLSEITEEEFQLLMAELLKVDYYPSLNSLAEALDSEDFTFDVYDIIESIGNLQASIDTTEIIDEVINDVTNLACGTSLIEEEKAESFKKRLGNLLGIEKIYYAAKADILINKFGNVYIQSRIISDVRPIFNLGEEDQAPKAGLILHSLNIHYDCNEEPVHKDITLSLTSYDIKNLLSVLKRAEKKESALRKFLEKAEMKNLND